MDTKSPFDYTLEEFVALSEEEREQIFTIAFEETKGYARNYFENHPAIEWIMIAQKSWQIVAQGNFTDFPDEDGLQEMAKKYNVPVFTYSRPPIIEEIAPSSGDVSPANEGKNYIMGNYGYKINY